MSFFSTHTLEEPQQLKCNKGSRLVLVDRRHLVALLPPWPSFLFGNMDTFLSKLKPKQTHGSITFAQSMSSSLEGAVWPGSPASTGLLSSTQSHVPLPSSPSICSGSTLPRGVHLPERIPPRFPGHHESTNSLDSHRVQ